MGAAVAPRHPATVAALLLAAAAAVAWLSLTGFAWTDYESEAAPPLAHLLDGRFGAFVDTAPAYGGSLLLRAPFAFAASALGGGELAVYRAMALPCLAAAAAIGWWLWRHHRDPRWALMAGLLAAANPLTIRALEIGHPEDLLGAVLCASAVLSAIRGRPWLAGALLGLALANKAWALLAVGPVLVALPGWRPRCRSMVAAGAVATVLLAPFALDREAAARAQTQGSDTGTIFQPWQVWWFAGDTGRVVRGADGQVKPSYRTPPTWLTPIPHPLIAATALPLTLLFLWRRRGARRGAPEDVLLLLALLFLLRCALDPWNIGYYHLPFVMALLAWETLRRHGPPILSLGATCLIWVLFEWLPQGVPPDAQAVAYLACAVPAVVLLARAAFGSCHPARPRLARGPAPSTAVG